MFECPVGRHWWGRERIASATLEASADDRVFEDSDDHVNEWNVLSLRNRVL